MTDSDKNGGGLPPAAYQKIDGNYVNLVIETDKETHIHQSEDVDGYKNWDKLVRRKDVKALIQEAVEHELEKVRDSLLMVTDKGGGTDRYRERLQQGLTYRMENLDVEELLEELEQ